MDEESHESISTRSRVASHRRVGTARLFELVGDAHPTLLPAVRRPIASGVSAIGCTILSAKGQHEAALRTARNVLGDRSNPTSRFLRNVISNTRACRSLPA